MIKKVLAIIVLAMVASLSISGCTSNTNNTASSPTPQAHDALLEKVLESLKQDTYGNASNTVHVWDMTWNNDTNVTVLSTLTQKSSGNISVNATISANETFLSFPTTQDATNIVNAFDKTNYSLTSTDYKTDTTSNAYYNATGHYPSVYKDYTYTEGSILGGSVKVYAITQIDNIVSVVKGSVTL